MVCKLTTPEAYARLQPSLLLQERRPVLCERIIFPLYSMVYGDCYRDSMLARQKGVAVLQVRLNGRLIFAEL